MFTYERNFHMNGNLLGNVIQTLLFILEECKIVIYVLKYNVFPYKKI